MSTVALMLSAAMLSSVMMGSSNMPTAQYKVERSLQNITVPITLQAQIQVPTQVAAQVSAQVPGTSFAGGQGTVEAPYQIANLQQLQLVKNDLHAHYILTADIDLSKADHWQPIGHVNAEAKDENFYADGFSGVFNGNGHTLYNLVIKEDEGVGTGLFGLVTSKGTVENLAVENAKITGKMATGAIIGYNCGTAKALTLKGENTITGNSCTGGMMGGNEGGNISSCQVENVQINVLGDNKFTGGRIIQCDIAECSGLIVGGSFGGEIKDCTAAGEIIAPGNEPVGIGGIGGCLEYMEKINNCHAYVKITAPHNAHAVGGLCGYAGTNGPALAAITNCSAHFEMDTQGATHIGGLVGTGLYYKGAETCFKLSGCRTYGTIKGAITPGTLAGRAEGSSNENCSAYVKIDNAKGNQAIGTTRIMYESADQ